MSTLIRVLLIDDERLFVGSLTKVLQKREMVVQAAHSGSAALAILSDEEFDVIVLDFKMPEMDGLMTLKEIRDRDPLTPVILLTGHIDIERLTEALKIGTTDVLLKPCPVEMLVSAIENANERRAIAKEVAERKINGP
ncbi:MAG: response regulator [Syntrophales bacterium]